MKTLERSRRVRVLVLLVWVVLAGACTAQRHPTTTPAAKPRTEVGLASWYGKAHHGKRTASGERMDMHELTAAHRTLALGSIVRVKDLESGRSVNVRINDRGPYRKGRIIDLTYAAAKKLGMIQRGTTRVEVTLVASR